MGIQPPNLCLKEGGEWDWCERVTGFVIALLGGIIARKPKEGFCLKEIISLICYVVMVAYDIYEKNGKS